MNLNITVSEAKSVRELHDTIEKLELQNKKLKEALKYYADGYGSDDEDEERDMRSYVMPCNFSMHGKRARAVLKEVENENN